jgi:hypothetical protein
MPGEPTKQFDSQRLAPVSFFRGIAVLGLVCTLVLIGASSLAGAARSSSATTSYKISASLTVNQFAIYEASWVKLTYKLPGRSKSFTYALRVKSGSQWQWVASGTMKTGGRNSMAVGRLFGGKILKVGSYRLELRCAGAVKSLTFTILAFSGHLTKKSFTVAQAASVKLIYAFSKPSKSFAYKLTFKQGSTWQAVASHKTIKRQKAQYFIEERTATLTSLFAGKTVKVGSYRLTISSAYSTRTLNFKVVTGGPSGTGGGTGIGGSGGGTGETGGLGFTISGGVDGLIPGQPKPIVLKLTNPNSFKIFVTKLTVAVVISDLPAGCQSNWFQLTQSNASNSNPITVPANGSTTLASAPQAPQIELIDSPTENQDACKGTSFGLMFTGSAHS